jgi:hypothetical protein
MFAFAKLKFSIALLLAAAVFAPSADAQGFGIGFNKHSKNGSIGVWWNGGHHGGHHNKHWKPAPPHCAQEWVPAHYETIREKVWVAGREEKVWVEPIYETRCDYHGRPIHVLVRPGHWKKICTPGHYEYCERKVWVEGCWRKHHQGY